MRMIGLAATGVSLLAVAGCNAEATGYQSCDALIEAGLGDSLLLPTAEGDAYFLGVQNYYSASMRELKPSCLLQPKDTEEVAKAVKALAPLSGAGYWQVAVRGGGHGHWGGNNVARGVTIDLSKMNKTTVRNNTCGLIASIGPGSRWGEVMQETEKHGVVVTGGRIGTVGVSGLTLGGGTSFHLAKRGLAANDVINFEVVLSDGSIVNANKRTNPKLFKALKGGSNNFGIVTRFDMVTHESTTMYGGIMFINWDHKDALVQNLIDTIDNSEEDPDSSMIAMFTYNAGNGRPQMGTIPMNLQGNRTATPFRGMNEMVSVMDMRMDQTLGQLLSMMRDEGGQRYEWYTLTFHNDQRMMDKAEELFMGLIEDAEAAFPGGSWAFNFVFQPFPKQIAQIKAGSTVMGLEESLTHNSILFAGESTVNTREEEAFFSAKLAVITAKLEAYAKSIDANIPFRYLPYASPAQDPLSSYGAKNVALLKEVAAEYDPIGFFQHRVTGGFKVSNII
ncbi:FAD-dependent monooxygenase CTB5 [Paramyrothecium foliicola]|nr:FAD-dependent monooxygenase CTB5 [Paramyrothecium foliicola]